MIEPPKLRLNLIDDSYTPDSQFLSTKDTVPVTRLLINPESPQQRRGSIGPSLLLTGDETPSRSNQGFPSSNKFDRRSSKFRHSVDAKTANFIDLLVRERRESFLTIGPSIVNKLKLDSFPKENGDFEHPTMDQKMVGKVVAMKKIKGLEDGIKDKQFHGKMDFFDQVITYVDTRKLFQDIEEPVKEATPKKSQGQGQTPKSTRASAEIQDFTQASKLAQVHSARDHHTSAKVTPKHSQFHNSAHHETPKAKKNDLKDNFSSAVSAHEGKEEESPMSVTDRKDQEIKRMYEQIKENAIQKLGPEIFEKAQKKLKDPKQVRRLQKKHKEELAEMKELQAELGNFEISRKIMDNLLYTRRSSIDMQQEIVDNFDKHVTNELDDRFIPLSSRPARGSITTPVSPKANKESEHERLPENDPQIQLLYKVHKHQQQSGEVIKLLKKKLNDMDKIETLSDSHSSPRIGARGSFTARKSKYSISGLPDSDHSSPLMLPGKEFHRSSERNSLLKSTLKLDLDALHHGNAETNTLKTEKQKVFLPRISKRDSMVTSMTTSPVNKDKFKLSNSINSHRDQLNGITSMTTSPINNINKDKVKSSNSINSHRDQLNGIRSNLESLATNKELNDKLKTMKAIAGTYTVPDITTPDSLKFPKKDKSTAKLATDLAAKIYKYSNVEGVIFQ